MRVCDEWLEYKGFKAWAITNGYADNLTIDRIDSNGNYEPENCQWITLAENIARAKRIPKNVEDKVIQMLKQGVSGVAIMSELHVSRPTVSRIKSEIGLAKPRKHTATE